MKSYAIADTDQVPDERFFSRIADLVEAGVDFIQLRAKSLDDRMVHEVALRCRALVSVPVRLLLNRRADLALAVGADGVHLPSQGIPVPAVRGLGPQLMVGRSCHSVLACRAAADEGVDYILLGPVFDARSKAAPALISADDLEQASQFGPAVYALGGISMDRLEFFKGLPVAGIAAVTLFMADEPLPRIVEEIRAL